MSARGAALPADQTIKAIESHKRSALSLEFGHSACGPMSALPPLELSRAMSALCQISEILGGYSRRLENELKDLANVCASARVRGSVTGWP